MWRQAVGASIVAIVLVFSNLVLGQQLNPFTAVLTTEISRQPIKEGRKRVILKNVSHSSQKSSQASQAKSRSKTATGVESAKRAEHKSNNKSTGPKAVPEKEPADKTDNLPADSMVSLSPDEGTTDLRRQIGVKYQVLIEKDGQLHPDDPKRIYHSGEAFRIKLESNINANLYLLAEDARTGERQLLFPNYKYQRGVERVKPFSAVVVPPLGQPAFAFDNNPGEERIIVICSRDEIPGLQLAPVESMPEAVKIVSSRALPTDIEQSIGKQQDDKKSEFGSRDFIWVSDGPTAKKTANAGTYVVNTSKKDNEEIVYVIRLKHGD